MYQALVRNFKGLLDAFAKAESALAAAEQAAAKSDPAMDKTDRANHAVAVYSAWKKRGALNTAMQNILSAIQFMTVYHVVMLEHDEPVRLNHAQKELVRILHAAQAKFLLGASARDQPARIDHGSSSRAPPQTHAPSEPESAQQETAQLPSCNWSEWSEHGRAGVTPASAESALAAAQSALEAEAEQWELALWDSCRASAMAARAARAELACVPSAGTAL